MSIVKPNILAGFLELSPSDQIEFNRIKDVIQRTYENFGFLPLDTPVLERSDVLLAKGGGETDQQVYRFERGRNDISMRFDLTVPLARYTAAHYSELQFPFRRYQIGKVYRGERNQRGRYREFYQCDIDIIGDQSLDIINDAEIPTVIYNIFDKLNIGKFTISVNNRKILNGFYESLGIEDTVQVLRYVDNLDKIGADGVKKQLKELDLSDDQIDKILEFTTIDGDNTEKIEKLKDLNIESETFQLGLEEIEQVLRYIDEFGVPEEYIKLDLSIARGLDYYTGTVYETLLDDHPEIGSICSGGRYEDLASSYINRKLPGVGISIGLSRLFFQLQEIGVLGERKEALTDVLVIPFDECVDDGIKLVAELRSAGVKTFLYTEKGRLGRKFGYADNLDIPYTIVVGQNEVETGRYGLKDMKSGDQEDMTVEEIIEKLGN